MKRAIFFIFCIFYMLFNVISCKKHVPADSPNAWKKIKMNFRHFDNEGLRGDTGGKVAVNYEFCIPKEEKYFNMIKKIDKTIEKHTSVGRSNCDKDSFLCIGNTHQPNFQKVLYDLASLPFVKEINETFWE